MNNRFIPYGLHNIDEADIEAVINVLKSGWITTGPTIEAFEKKLAAFTGTQYAVALSSGTAALHCAYAACGIGPGDEVIVPAITFVATANAAIYLGAIPVVADVDEHTLLLDPESVVKKITPRTKAIIAVDYGGQPCDYEILRRLANKHGLYLISDSCHALGAHFRGHPVAHYAHLVVYSFHPVKHITTGEGGAVATNDKAFAHSIKCLRNHGIDVDFKTRQQSNTFEYDLVTLGWNYRITDFQCALGISQLDKLERWLKLRTQLADLYDKGLTEYREIVTPLKKIDDRRHVYHLYVVKFKTRDHRDFTFQFMRSKGIGVNVHYKPLNLHSYYQDRFHMKPGMAPVAEKAYELILTLPLHQSLSSDDVSFILEQLEAALRNLC